MGAGRVGRPGRPAELIGGQCRDNTPIVEDKGGCVPLELDTREAGEAESQPQLCPLSPLLYLDVLCCVGASTHRGQAHSFTPQLSWSGIVGSDIFNGNKGMMNSACPYIEHFYNKHKAIFAFKENSQACSSQFC